MLITNQHHGSDAVQQFRIITAGLILTSLLTLEACSQPEQAGDKKVESPAISSPISQPTSTTTSKKQNDSHSSGGNVVESQGIHLEFGSEKFTKDTHLDVFVQQSDNHESIPNAKVTALVQSPDGTQQSLDLKYDTAGKHYAALLSETAPGQYQVKVIANVNGKKVDGRFTFDR
jgi:hypothetical protein